MKGALVPAAVHEAAEQGVDGAKALHPANFICVLEAGCISQKTFSLWVSFTLFLYCPCQTFSMTEALKM